MELYGCAGMPSSIRNFSLEKIYDKTCQGFRQQRQPEGNTKRTAKERPATHLLACSRFPVYFLRLSLQESLDAANSLLPMTILYS